MYHAPKKYSCTIAAYEQHKAAQAYLCKYRSQKQSASKFLVQLRINVVFFLFSHSENNTKVSH